MADKRTCTWIEDSDGIWWSECEGSAEGWEFNSGGPRQNFMRFCPFCGRKLVPAPMPVEED